MSNETESRFSQDQDWNVHEPEGAQLSETELAEIRRLQDSTSRAEGPDPSAPVLTPILPPPKSIPPPKVRTPPLPSIPNFEELVPFREMFPDIFETQTLQTLIANRLNRFDPSLYTTDEIVMMILTIEMQRLIDLHKISEGHPCQTALKKMTIHFLKSHFSTMKLLVDSLLISARHLKLPNSAAKEKAELTALEFLTESLETSDLAPKIIPPSSKIQKSLSEALLRAISPLVPPSTAPSLTQKLILAVTCEEALTHYLDEISPLPYKPVEVKENLMVKSLTTAEKMALFATLLIPIQKVNLLFFFLIAFLREISNNHDGSKLAEGFLFGIETALSDSISASTLEEVIKSLWFIAKVIQKTGLFNAISPNSKMQKILEDFVQRLKTPQTKFAEKASPELEKQLNLIHPSREQARGFADRLLRYLNINQAEIEISA